MPWSFLSKPACDTNGLLSGDRAVAAQRIVDADADHIVTEQRPIEWPVGS